METKENRKTLYLIDGTALAYRSYFAFMKNPLMNSKGMNTGAIYGFTLIMMKILKEQKPDYMGVVFDSKEPTFRHKKFKEYKATREKMPDEMIDQLPYIERLVKAFSLPFIIYPTYEADDIIATLVNRYEQSNFEIFVVSGDKDLMQLVSDNVKMVIPKKGGESEIIDHDGVIKKFGVPPSKIADLLSLMGDSSDNIPGVPGIGEKTAKELITKFDTLECVLKSPDKIEKAKIAQSIRDNIESALLSRELVTLDKNVPLEIELADLQTSGSNEALLAELFKELEFNSLLENLSIGEQIGDALKKYTLVNNTESLPNLFQKFKSSGFFVFDTETTSLNPIDAEIVGISFCFEEREAYYLPLNMDPKNGWDNFEKNKLIAVLKPIFENEKILKGGHNVKYDSLVLKKYGIEVKGISFDTMIESYLLDPSARQHNLDLVALKNLKYRKIPIESLIGSGKSVINMKDASIPKVSEYSCEDSDITMRLHNLFIPEIKKLKLDKLYEEVELPLMHVLSDMEWEGVSVDTNLMEKISLKIENELKNLKEEIFKKAGEEFNINSHKQLGVVLFERLKVHEALGIKRIKKTKTGYSTDSSVLETLSEHPIINKILEFRNLSKLKSTYLDALPALINKTTKRIHTSFNQTVTATGRLSSSDPNLQNIPIRTEAGREIRKAFIPKTADSSLISADYSQIELRILAHLSQDENLIKTFEEGVDVHRRTAAKIFGISDDKVDSTLRNRAKAINFGIIYGMGPQRLSRETKIPLSEAEDFINSYFKNYPNIKKFIDGQIEFAKENGFVLTLLGRRRYIPEILSENPRLKINAEHIAVNTPIQGSAADMIKISMINIYSKLKSLNLKTKMIIQIHDELVFESPDEEVDLAEKLVIKEMEGAIKLDVPVKVEIKHGKSWFEAH